MLGSSFLSIGACAQLANPTRGQLRSLIAIQ